MDIVLLQELARWEEHVSPAETGDPPWKLHAYRLSRYLIDCCVNDVRDATPAIHAQTADQLRRAVTSISANLTEGYSRRTANDRLRFYTYALGSLREAIVWYLSVQNHLSPDLLQRRLDQLAQTRRLVLGMHATVGRTGGWNPRVQRPGGTRRGQRRRDGAREPERGGGSSRPPSTALVPRP